MIGSWSRRVLAGLGSPVRSRKEKKAAALCLKEARRRPKGAQIQTPALETILRRACLDEHLQFVVLPDLIARVDASLFVSLLAYGLAVGLIDIQFIETTKWLPNKEG